MYLHKEFETLTRPEIEKLQLKRLKETVRQCLHAPFYQKRFAKNNLQAEDIQSLEDLRKILSFISLRFINNRGLISCFEL